MRCLSVFLVVAVLALCSAVVAAPVRALADEAATVEEAGAVDGAGTVSDYAQVARARGIDHAVTYGDMRAPPADGSGALEPRPKPQAVDATGEPGGEGVDLVTWIIVAGLAALIGFLVWKYGGTFHRERLGKVDAGSRPSMSRTPESASAGGDDGPPLGLDALARMGAGDGAAREEALVRLVELVLRRVLSRHGSDLRRSVTTREALRAVPGTSPWRAPLLDIVLGAERVRFGGWPLSQPAFERYLTAARAILDERKPDNPTGHTA